MRISWRLASRLSVITLAVLVVIIVALWGVRNGSGASVSGSNAGQSGLIGTDMDSLPAPDFHLTDQHGKPISLTQFYGKPVVLTFLYTHCPDVCPLTAEKLYHVRLQLGAQASQVEMLAVSIDPKGDTRAAALAFSQEHRMADYWHYLIGSHTELAPIWSAYSVDSQAIANSTKYTHTSGVYLIDETGRERVFFGDDFTPTQMAGDLQILLKE